MSAPWILELVALVGGTVHGLEPGAAPRVASVLIEDGRITAVGSELELPQGTRVVDVSGRHVVPGLIDGLAYHDPLHDLLYTAAGVTLIRDHGNDAAQVLSEASPKARERSPGPWISTAGAVLDGYPPSTGAALVLRDEHEARHRTQALIAEGVDFLSVQVHLGPEAFGAVLEVAAEAGLQVWGPLPSAVPLETALAAGRAGRLAGLLFLDGLLPAGTGWSEVSPEELDLAVERVAESGLALVPLLSGTARLLSDQRALAGGEPPELLSVGPEHAGHWSAELAQRAPLLADPAWLESGRKVLEVQRGLVRRLHAAGVPLVPGSGAPHPWLVPGQGLHAELEQWVAAGIPPGEVLWLATGGAAAALDLGDRGLVAAGQVADLLVLASDPRASIAALEQIDTVVLRGRVFEQVELDQRLSELEERLSELRARLGSSLEVAPPALPEGAVVLRGLAETESVAGRLAAERFAVVREVDDALTFAGRRASRSSAGEAVVEVSQRLREGRLQSFSVTLSSGGRELVVQGLLVAGQMRVERRLDGQHLGTLGVKETLAAVDAGSLTTPMLLGQTHSSGPLPVLRFDQALELEVVRWELALNEQGDLAIRTPVGIQIASFEESGSLRVLVEQTGSGSLTTQVREIETLGGPGLGMPADKLARMRAARAGTPEEAAAPTPPAADPDPVPPPESPASED